NPHQRRVIGDTVTGSDRCAALTKRVPRKADPRGPLIQVLIGNFVAVWRILSVDNDAVQRIASSRDDIPGYGINSRSLLRVVERRIEAGQQMVRIVRSAKLRIPDADIQRKI